MALPSSPQVGPMQVTADDQGTDQSLTLCLAGDVMCGRGIDQIMGQPGDPTIYERWAESAASYVELAEQRSGPIQRAVGPDYVWGDVLPDLRQAAPDVFIVNLETAVTDRGSPWPGKGIQYRMHPANVDFLTAAGVDVAVLANNHVLDWSVAGLEQTIEVLRASKLGFVGAGHRSSDAWAPAVLDREGGRRVLVFGVGARSSGIPGAWAATDRSPGVALIPDLSDATLDQLAAMVQSAAGPHDIVVLSLHWGGNWGYDISEERQHFARRLVDEAGVHVLHGHSSHHPLRIEVHHGRLILYGCGDLITDYEGIRGHEKYRGELGALYLATIDASSGDLRDLELVPTEVRRFQLTRPSAENVRWLADVLNRDSAPSGTTVAVTESGTITATW